ncbi:DUF916 domain-containing protein, partial [Listeria monocytogenes]|nr:DUF916 domain-containing protein [Listeria monocytogenes]
QNFTIFNLGMLLNQKQTIIVVVDNFSNENAKFLVKINQAYTNKQGFIDYTSIYVKFSEKGRLISKFFLIFVSFLIVVLLLFIEGRDVKWIIHMKKNVYTNK